MRLIVTKMGGTFYTQDQTGQSASGEGGETEGLLRHLAKDHEVMFFGRHYGTVPGVKFLPMDFKGLDEWTSGEEIIERCRPALEEARGAEAFICVNGYAVTMAWPDNPRGVMVQAASVRYTAPQLWLIKELGVPRICISNDPRTYAREQEMVEMWPEVTPAALLGQQNKSWVQRISRTPHRISEVYAAAETWCTKRRLERTRDRDVFCVAHAHIRDGVKTRSRADVWGKIQHVIPKIYGKGWEHAPFYDPERFPGVITQQAVDEGLAAAKVCPIVSIQDGFYTGKMLTVISQGCLPLLWGRGESLTYDHEYRYVPKDSPLRFTSASELQDAIHRYCTDEAARAAAVRDLQRRLSPNFEVLDRCLENVHNLPMKEFGGYENLSR